MNEIKTYIILEISHGITDWQILSMYTQEEAVRWIREYVKGRKELNDSYSVRSIYEAGENITGKVLGNII